MNIQTMIQEATDSSGRVNIVHYTNVVLKEACRLIKDTPITGAYTSFDAEVAKTQRAECFNSVYKQIVENLNGNNS